MGFESRGLRRFTESYTGDGNMTQAITGVGFKPRVVRIVRKPPLTVPMPPATVFIKMDNYGFEAERHDSGIDVFETNLIVSLDADGFTVSDNGLDDDPNKNRAKYKYLCEE